MAVILGTFLSFFFFLPSSAKQERALSEERELQL